MSFKKLRKNKFTQIEFAKLLGVSQQAVSRWESGGSAPRVSMIARIAKVLGVSAADIVACFEESGNDCKNDMKR